MIYLNYVENYFGHKIAKVHDLDKRIFYFFLDFHRLKKNGKVREHQFHVRIEIFAVFEIEKNFNVSFKEITFYVVVNCLKRVYPISDKNYPLGFTVYHILIIFFNPLYRMK